MPANRSALHGQGRAFSKRQTPPAPPRQKQNNSGTQKNDRWAPSKSPAYEAFFRAPIISHASMKNIS
jgi:hypothetical protein